MHLLTFSIRAVSFLREQIILISQCPVHPIRVALTVSKKIAPLNSNMMYWQKLQGKMQQLIFILRETPCGLLMATEVETSSVV